MKPQTYRASRTKMFTLFISCVVVSSFCFFITPIDFSDALLMKTGGVCFAVFAVIGILRVLRPSKLTIDEKGVQYTPFLRKKVFRWEELESIEALNLAFIGKISVTYRRHASPDIGQNAACTESSTPPLSVTITVPSSMTEGQLIAMLKSYCKRYSPRTIESVERLSD